jgi:ABC-type branched-subunit amino acid transport system ATPase component
VTAPPALALEGLRRTFGALTAVNDVTLSLAPRERRAPARRRCST